MNHLYKKGVFACAPFYTYSATVFLTLTERNILLSIICKEKISLIMIVAPESKEENLFIVWDH